MTKQQLRQFRAHYQQQIDRATKQIKEAEQAYIRDNAPYQVGSKVQIDTGVKIQDVQIQTYNIDENGILTPVFVSLEGKCVFCHNPTIIKEI